ncbi:MAG: hypothetical protein LBC75_09085 [Fibromonadaceae bacterium]|nr:hypothetical protein [Fibromonadaceae bacterium]
MRNFLITTFAVIAILGCGNNDESSDSGSLLYQGKTYRTVKINKQTWMAENINHDVNGSVCYNNKESNCDTYGRLYNWSAAMSACPSGWYLPSNADWDDLYRYIDGTSDTLSPYTSSTAGKYLKSNNKWNGGGNGEDKYGFSALPGGYSNSVGYFSNIGNYGFWWSSSEFNSNYAYSRNMYYDNDEILYDRDDKSYLFSVRCIQK